MDTSESEVESDSDSDEGELRSMLPASFGVATVGLCLLVVPRCRQDAFFPHGSAFRCANAEFVVKLEPADGSDDEGAGGEAWKASIAAVTATVACTQLLPWS